MITDKIVGERKRKLSFSSIDCFLDCRRSFWYSRIERYEIIMPNLNFFIGNLIHKGVELLFKKEKRWLDIINKEYKTMKMVLRSKYPLTYTQEEELIKIQIIVEGMLKGYLKHYKDKISKTKHIEKEMVIVVPLKQGYRFKIKFDNLIEVKNKYYIHELKTKRSIDVSAVKAIKNDLQTNIYYHFANKSGKIKVSGILYDIIKKPSIRQKKQETKTGYLHRLKKYYDVDDVSQVFYSEYIEKPIISENNIFNTVFGVIKDLEACKNIKDFYKNYKYCYVYGRCDYYRMCILGEKPDYLVKPK